MAKEELARPHRQPVKAERIDNNLPELAPAKSSHKHVREVQELLRDRNLRESKRIAPPVGEKNLARAI
jgi:hypothetical protein